MQNGTDLSRRSFFKVMSGLVIGLAAGGDGLVAWAKGTGLPAGKTAASESEPTAAALGYREMGSKVDKAKFPTFKADQKCTNCSFYTKLNDKWGSCQLIQSGAVAANGWCASWVKKA